MTYEFYKILHLVGLVTLFTSLGAAALVPLERRKPYIILHGIAMAVMLIAGFGLLARLGVMHTGLPVWAWIKVVIWLALGGTPTILRKKPQFALQVLLFTIALGSLAAWTAIMKPGA